MDVIETIKTWRLKSERIDHLENIIRMLYEGNGKKKDHVELYPLDKQDSLSEEVFKAKSFVRKEDVYVPISSIIAGKYGSEPEYLSGTILLESTENGLENHMFGAETSSGFSRYKNLDQLGMGTSMRPVGVDKERLEKGRARIMEQYAELKKDLLIGVYRFCNTALQVTKKLALSVNTALPH